jgi:hypothetical protein
VSLERGRVKAHARDTLDARKAAGGSGEGGLVTKGISERFDEEEHDTARRDYSRDVLDLAKRTAHHRIVKLEEPRTESGTRAIVPRSETAAHAPDDEGEPIVGSVHAPLAETPPAVALPMAPLAPPRPIHLLVVLGLALFVAGLGALGFLLGRLTH